LGRDWLQRCNNFASRILTIAKKHARNINIGLILFYFTLRPILSLAASLDGDKTQKEPWAYMPPKMTTGSEMFLVFSAISSIE